jgi:DNA-binding NarL/FixJ family response regulator
MAIRILIVEDEWLQAENLEDALRESGHSICGTASTGEQAVRLAAAEQPDVVVMDVKLPGRIDGVEAAAQIMAVLPTCGVVFVTAYDDRSTLARMERLRPRAIVRKPAKQADVLAAVTGDDQPGKSR